MDPEWWIQGNAHSASRVSECADNPVNEFLPFKDFLNFVHPTTHNMVSCADFYPAARDGGATGSWLENQPIDIASFDKAGLAKTFAFAMRTSVQDHAVSKMTVEASNNHVWGFDLLCACAMCANERVHKRPLTPSSEPSSADVTPQKRLAASPTEPAVMPPTGPSPVSADVTPQKRLAASPTEPAVMPPTGPSPVAASPTEPAVMPPMGPPGSSPASMSPLASSTADSMATTRASPKAVSAECGSAGRGAVVACGRWINVDCNADGWLITTNRTLSLLMLIDPLRPLREQGKVTKPRGGGKKQKRQQKETATASTKQQRPDQAHGGMLVCPANLSVRVVEVGRKTKKFVVRIVSFNPCHSGHPKTSATPASACSPEQAKMAKTYIGSVKTTAKLHLIQAQINAESTSSSAPQRSMQDVANMVRSLQKQEADVQQGKLVTPTNTTMALLAPMVADPECGFVAVVKFSDGRCSSLVKRCGEASTLFIAGEQFVEGTRGESARACASCARAVCSPSVVLPWRPWAGGGGAGTTADGCCCCFC